MPWCNDCSRFWNPSSMGRDGTCPTCGRVLASTSSRPVPGLPAEERSALASAPEVSTRIPWHFWVLVVALAVYLGWRLVQLIGWVLG